MPGADRGLVLFRSSASGASVVTPERREMILDVLEEHWGEGALLPLYGPSAAEDEAFRGWWARFERAAATNAAARTLLEVAARTDVTGMLPEVRVPTLVLHRTEDALVDVSWGRQLAEGIPGARLVELKGRDNLGFLGDGDALLDEVEEFLTGGHRPRKIERVLATILFTDIVESTVRAATVGDLRWRDLLDALDRIVRAQIERFGGDEVKTVGDGFLASFPLPSSGVRCARAIRDAVGELGLEVRAGLHTGECDLLDDDLGGLAVHIASRLVSIAGAGEVLASETVSATAAGSGCEFQARGTQELRGVPGRWRIFAA